MIKIKYDDKSILATKELLKALAFPPAKRKKLLYRAAKNISIASKRNITKQETPGGKAWAKRSAKAKSKRKLLLGLKKLIVVSQSDKNCAKITLRKGMYKSGVHAAVLGNIHEHGQIIKQSASKPKQKQSGYCTRGQAKMLKKIGFRVWARRINKSAKSGRTKVPTITWMTKNLKQEEIRAVLNKLKDQGFVSTKKSWVIKLPAREFLGASATETRKAWERAFQSIDYGWNVRANQIKK